MNAIEHIPTVCPCCGCGCGIELVLKNGEIAGVEPLKSHPVCKGKNCLKGKNAYLYANSEERLTTPLIKKNGKHEACSWDEALDWIAQKLSEADRDAVGFINSGKCTNEDLYLIQKFARIVCKTNNLDNASRFCHSTSVPALLSTVGAWVMPTSTPSIEKADCVLIMGANIQETYPLLAQKVIIARTKGAKIITADLRRTPTVKNLTDLHLQTHPGTDAALINGMMKIILDQGLANTDFIEKRTSGFDELKAYLDTLDLQEIEKITGIKTEQMKDAALSYASAHNACIMFNAGIAQHAGGVETIQTLADMALLTGNYGKPGSGVNPLRGHSNGEGFGDMGTVPVFYPGFQKVNEETAGRFASMWDAADLPAKPGLTYMEMVEKCPFLYIMGANPAMSAPDINALRKAFEKKELVIVQDIFMTETAQMADVVLAGACGAEKDGTQTGVDRRVQRLRKAIAPVGDALPDWQILCRLAEKMGAGEHFAFKTSEEIFEEIRNCVPQYRGITYERLEQAGGIQWPCPDEGHPGTETMFVEKFGTPDGLAHFQAAPYKAPLEPPDDAYPYILTTGRLNFHFHTGSMTRRTERLQNEISEAFAEISPQDSENTGIADGEEVILRSRRGEVKTRARVTPDIKAGQVFLPWHFPQCLANILTGPSAGPPSRMPEFKFSAIQIEKVESDGK